MSFKETVDAVGNNLKAGAENIKDTVSAAAHRTNADAEQASRDIAGKDMKPGEYVGSVVRQGTETVKAGIDEAKIQGLKANVAANETVARNS
jgi:F420-0:gamma-glutamyl ligase